MGSPQAGPFLLFFFSLSTLFPTTLGYYNNFNSRKYREKEIYSQNKVEECQLSIQPSVTENKMKSKTGEGDSTRQS